jgi:site-specific recombinase XerD
LAKYLKSTPVIFVDYVAAFERWASQGMLNPKLDMEPPESRPLTNTPRAILGTVKVVGIFLQWCVKRNILSLAEVNQSTIESYKETLFWQYECQVCGKRAHVDVDKTSEKCGDGECQAMNACVKIRRLTRGSVTEITVKLRTFFNWAQLHNLVLENPLRHEVFAQNTFTAMNERGEMIEISDSIRRYEDNVVERLGHYIVTPDADLREALVLYFIIVHKLTVTEICKAKLPSLAAETRGTCDRAKDFEYLLLPVRQRTRGQLSRGREDPILKYPKEAAWWLRPLLERYLKQRRNNVGSEYLIVGPCHLARNNRPVSKRTINRLVHRASQRVLNAMISPRDLRNTAAAIRANKSKRRGAILTKLGYSSERATRFNYLETFLLEPKPFKQRQPPAGA